MSRAESDQIKATLSRGLGSTVLPAIKAEPGLEPGGKDGPGAKPGSRAGPGLEPGARAGPGAKPGDREPE